MTHLRALLAALLAAFALVLVETGAHAIPPDGAGADTPGTSASVSPRTLAPGATIRFTLSGFPAGEVVYVKIDDGTECDAAAVHGACVYHQQRIGSSGSVSGSFEVPTGLKPGAHWLRFLASEEMTDKDGTYLGVKGYTHRGGTDFTVVAATKGTTTKDGDTGTSGSTGAPGTTTTSSGTTGGSTGTGTAADKLVVAAPTAAATASATPAATASATPSAAAPAEAPVTSTPAPVAAPAAAPADAGSGVPWIGVGAVAVALVVGAGLGLRARRR